MEMISNIKKLITDDREKNNIYDQLSAVVDSINKSKIIDGILIESIALKANTVSFINHKLGRKYNGFIVVKNPNGDVFSDKTTDATSLKSVGIKCSNDTTISIWVF